MLPFALPLTTALIESVLERFDKVLSNIGYEVAMALHPHFRLSLMWDAENQFYQFSSKSTREKIKDQDDRHG